MKKNPSSNKFTYLPVAQVFKVVERFDDVEIIIGYMVGLPYVGGKFGDPAKGVGYKIVDVDPQFKTVVVE